MVRLLCQWVETNTQWTQAAALLSSLPEHSARAVPPVINGFVPDVYLKSNTEDIAIIGEAKTELDLERPRSRHQLVAFMKHLTHFGTSRLVIAVPWQCRIQAQSLAEHLKKRHDLTAVSVTVIAGS